MSKRRTLTEESFESLLSWLAPERESAGRQYEDIRQALVKIFTWNGIPEAEDMADETINRVTQKVQELRDTYQGDPALYFYGVAKKLILEYRRGGTGAQIPRSTVESLSSPPTDDSTERDRELDCLEKCLEMLPDATRELILRYYSQRKWAKVESRKKLAETLGLDANALRVRVYRIRATLELCVRECLESDESDGPS